MVNISFNSGGYVKICYKLINSYWICQIKFHFFVEKFVFLYFFLLFLSCFAVLVCDFFAFVLYRLCKVDELKALGDESDAKE